MLDKVSHIDEKLRAIYEGLYRDSKSFKGWYALYMTFPHRIGEDIHEISRTVADILSATLNSADGFICQPHVYGILVVCHKATKSEIMEAGLQASEWVQSNADVMPVYQLFSFMRDHKKILPMITHWLEQDAPMSPTWSCSGPLFYNRSPDTPAHLDKQKRVLLVEDDPVTRWLVRNALRHECEMVTASTAGKALDLYKTYAPDVVFLDIGLPDRRGTDVLNEIVAHDPAARVVMFTHKDDFDTLATTLADGAVGYITKPFHRNRLLQYLS
jgi:CheY-like chemotaxis protein